MRVAAPVALALSAVAIAGTLLPADADDGAARIAAEPARGPGRNVVFVLTDDMRVDDLAYMPATRRLIAREGVSFTNAYAVDPVCCPSRVSILTGQYAHNSGVEANFFPQGGFASFDDDRSVATWLNSRGYRTGYVGKYLNQYALNGRLYVPPGWDSWKTAVRGVYAYRGSTVYNTNGKLTTLPGYQTDTVTRMATNFIADNARQKMFLHVAYSAPHPKVETGGLGSPPVPAKRHAHAYDGVRPPSNDPAYDEANVSDKPQVVRRKPLTNELIRRTQQVTEARRESLLAVDEGVQRIVAALRRTGTLGRTTIVFASDNGYFMGEHRHPGGKHLAYEPVAQVPLLMRGPNIPHGVTRRQVVGLHDLAPTFLRLAGSPNASGGFPVDGMDLVPFIRNSGASTGRDLLIESLNHELRWHRYDAIRTASGYKYVEYSGPGVELYNLSKDPSETTNLAGRRGFADLRRRLADRLDAVRECAARGCR